MNSRHQTVDSTVSVWGNPQKRGIVWSLVAIDRRPARLLPWVGRETGNLFGEPVALDVVLSFVGNTPAFRYPV